MNSKKARRSVEGLFIVGVVLAVFVPGCKAGDQVWGCECSNGAVSFETQICSADDPVVTAQDQCTKGGDSNAVCGDCACSEQEDTACTPTQ